MFTSRSSAPSGSRPNRNCQGGFTKYAGDKYRIKSPTIALFLEGGRHVAHLVPKDSVVVVQAEELNGDRIIEVLWTEKLVMMFTQDIRTRGEKVA
jgi:hypothetical protein